MAIAFCSNCVYNRLSFIHFAVEVLKMNQFEHWLHVASLAKNYAHLSKEALTVELQNLDECLIIAKCNGFLTMCNLLLDNIRSIILLQNGAVYHFVTYDAVFCMFNDTKRNINYRIFKNI